MFQLKPKDTGCKNTLRRRVVGKAENRKNFI